MPKPLSELKTFYGKIGKMSFDSKSSLGTMIFILDDNSYKKISIYKDKKDIYDKVINKKVKIYTSNLYLLHIKLKDKSSLILGSYEDGQIKRQLFSMNKKEVEQLVEYLNQIKNMMK